VRSERISACLARVAQCPRVMRHAATLWRADAACGAQCAARAGARFEGAASLLRARACGRSRSGSLSSTTSFSSSGCARQPRVSAPRGVHRDG